MNGLSFCVRAHCIHEHYPPGDWALHREGGEIVAVMQASGTVIVNQSVQERDRC